MKRLAQISVLPVAAILLLVSVLNSRPVITDFSPASQPFHGNNGLSITNNNNDLFPVSLPEIRRNSTGKLAAPGIRKQLADIYSASFGQDYIPSRGTVEPIYDSISISRGLAVSDIIFPFHFFL